MWLLEVITYFGEGFACNSHLIVDKKDAVLVDCSVSPEKLTHDLNRLGATLKTIILTHGHFDHIETLDEVRDITGAPVCIHEKDAEMLTDGMKNGYSDFFHGTFSVKPANKTVTDGDIITAGDISLNVIHTPGHSKGSTCFRFRDHLFTGDTLFANNIGRNDLYGGDGATLYRSLKKLSALRSFADDSEIKVYPGHGPLTTLEREIEHNYYIRDALALE